MNPEAKRIWVEALRSGKYEQCKSKLHDGEGYCCLGVLSDVSPFEMKTAKVNTVHEGAITVYYWDDPDSEAHSNGVLSKNVVEWAGLDDVNPVIGRSPAGTPLSASYFNDIEKLSFEQIADLIEENL